MNYQQVLDRIREAHEVYMTHDGYLNKLKIVEAFGLSQTQWQVISELWREQRTKKQSRGNDEAVSKNEN